MSKAYSNKALPSGTIIREWRLEDVLGVGGFGIVYKGRGIYFGELVAIKEYFPSSISERDAESTVVPIGSDVEEVHARPPEELRNDRNSYRPVSAGVRVRRMC